MVLDASWGIVVVSKIVRLEGIGRMCSFVQSISIFEPFPDIKHSGLIADLIFFLILGIWPSHYPVGRILMLGAAFIGERFN